VPSAPTAYPLGPPTISGNQITVDELLNQPERITRDIADLAMQRFYMDRVFTAGGGVNGGAVLSSWSAEPARHRPVRQPRHQGSRSW
jgi:hypothetical protein